MQSSISHKNWFFGVVLSRWKATNFKLHRNFSLKNCKSNFEILVTPLFDEIHCSPINYVTTWNIWFRFYFFIAPRRSQKRIVNFVTFVPGEELNSWCLLRPWARITFYTLSGKGSINTSSFIHSFIVMVCENICTVPPRANGWRWCFQWKNRLCYCF